MTEEPAVGTARDTAGTTRPQPTGPRTTRDDGTRDGETHGSGTRGRWAGIAAVAGTKTLDGVVTVVALSAGGVIERNPVAAAVFDAIGVAVGVTVSALVAVCLVVGGVEWGCARLDHATSAVTLRVVGYGPLALVWLVVACYGAWLSGLQSAVG